MKFFVDSSDVQEIRDLAKTGLVDGVTTNPSLIAKSGRDFRKIIAEICDIIEGPVSAQVVALDAPTMITEGHKLKEIADNVVVKLPLTTEGLIACKALSSQGIHTNLTLCFSANQALLAAKAGATYVSPFIGRLDDSGENGMQLIEDILRIYRNYSNLHTEILVASVRHPEHVSKAALLGAHIATIPPNILRNLVNHTLTDKGLEAFHRDSIKAGLRIL